MAAALSATPPTPLSPDQFDPSNPALSSGGQPAAAPEEVDFNDADRATLQAALEALKAARANGKSSDPKVADPANQQVVALVGYLVGFFDSRGLISDTALEPGFQRLFGANAQPDRETALSELEAALEAAASAVETRGVRQVIGSALQAVGAVLLAIGTVV